MNQLHRTIQPGEIVVMSAAYYQGHEPIDRAFICETGFGLDTFTRGSKIFGRWVDGTGNDEVSGYEIDPVQTRELQTELQAAEALELAKEIAQ
jgi:hypothetical protein